MGSRSLDVRVLGCHGGETPKHRTSAFLLNGVVALDAGALTATLTLAEQAKLELVAVTHAHLDHVRDLATIADNRCQMGCPPLTVAATKGTIQTLRTCFFNDRLWPDFTRIPTKESPTLRFVELEVEKARKFGAYEVMAVPVSHTVEAAALLVRTEHGSLAYTGDTGPTDRLWEVLEQEPDLKAAIVEVSYPDERQELATVSGHHSPRTLAADLRKLRAPESLPTYLFHIKPRFQREVETQVARLRGLALDVVQLDDEIEL